MSLVKIIQYLPYFIELYHSIMKRIEEDQKNRKVADDLKAITEAFNEKNPDKLKHIFNDGLPDSPK